MLLSDTKRAGQPVSNGLAFFVGCLAVAMSSGGLILGTGPFVTQALEEHYIRGQDISAVFDGAFQIMTWGTALACHWNDRLGPRFTALLGCCIALCGHGLFLTMTAKPTSLMRLLLSYGLIGWGGNTIFVSSFHFARLFPKNIGLADGIISSLFNVSGLWFLLWNIPGLTLKELFGAWVCVVLCLAVLIAIFFPDQPYSSGEQAVISCPSCKHMTNPFSLSSYRSTVGDLFDSRYVLFAFTFGFSVCYSLYIQGEIVGGMFEPSDVPSAYINWGYPCIVNATILLSWAVGWSIDKMGFFFVGLLQALVATLLMVLGLFPQSQAAAWAAIVAVLLLHSLQYTIEWAFLHKAMREGVFPVASLFMLLIQGFLGFLVWPIFTPNPWGDKNPTPLWILLFGSVLLYIWPVAELLVYSKRPSLNEIKTGGGAGSSFISNNIGKGN